MSNSNIIIELGFNHLGSQYLLDHLIDIVIKNSFDFTFQIRTKEFPSKKKLELSVDLILERIRNIKKKKGMTSKVGFALDSFHYINEIERFADFIKLLAFFEDKEKYLKNTSFSNPIYVSLGLDSISKVKKLFNAAKLNSKKFNALYTSYDKTGMDISTKEIYLINSFSDSISFGYHQNDISKLIVISSLVKFQNIFVYINPGFIDKNNLLPDSNHSLKVEEILRLRDALNFQEKISLNSNRETFKKFTNE